MNIHVDVIKKKIIYDININNLINFIIRSINN